MFGFLETFDIAETLTLIFCFCCLCCFVKRWELSSCLPKRDEVLVVIENMMMIIILVRVFIYIRACCSSLMEGKKSVALSAVKTENL